MLLLSTNWTLSWLKEHFCVPLTSLVFKLLCMARLGTLSRAASCTCIVGTTSRGCPRLPPTYLQPPPMDFCDQILGLWKLDQVRFACLYRRVNMANLFCSIYYVNENRWEQEEQLTKLFSTLNAQWSSFKLPSGFQLQTVQQQAPNTLHLFGSDGKDNGYEIECRLDATGGWSCDVEAVYDHPPISSIVFIPDRQCSFSTQIRPHCLPVIYRQICQISGQSQDIPSENPRWPAFETESGVVLSNRYIINLSRRYRLLNGCRCLNASWTIFAYDLDQSRWLELGLRTNCDWKSKAVVGGISTMEYDKICMWYSREHCPWAVPVHLIKVISHFAHSFGLYVTNPLSKRVGFRLELYDVQTIAVEIKRVTSKTDS